MRPEGNPTDAKPYFDGTNTEMLLPDDRPQRADAVRTRREFWREPQAILSRVVDAGLDEASPDIQEAS